MILYDVVDFVPTSFKLKKEDSPSDFGKNLNPRIGLSSTVSILQDTNKSQDNFSDSDNGVKFKSRSEGTSTKTVETLKAQNEKLKEDYKALKKLFNEYADTRGRVIKSASVEKIAGNIRREYNCMSGDKQQLVKLQGDKRTVPLSPFQMQEKTATEVAVSAYVTYLPGKSPGKFVGANELNFCVG